MGMGRPRKPYKSIYKHFYIPEYLVALLDKENNQSETVTEALEMHYKSIGQSDQLIIKEIEKHEKIVNQLRSVLRHNEEIQNNKEIKEKKLKSEYYEFCKLLQNPNRDGHYNTDRANKKYDTKLKDHNHFVSIQKLYKEGNFSIQKFKQLKEGFL